MSLKATLRGVAFEGDNAIITSPSGFVHDKTLSERDEIPDGYSLCTERECVGGGQLESVLGYAAKYDINLNQQAFAKA